MEKVKERTGIYHEHQQGALCAQHALNNLLQNPVFLADALADIARELDKEEKSVLAHASHESENMDDTGFFNIQVLQRALKIWEIELIPFGSQEPIAQQARSRPDSVQAYICNLGLHWFTVRRFARQYFNLNSIYYVPELIPAQMLSHYVNIIKENGYSIFIVHGTLPACVADEQLAINPVSYQEYALLIKDLPKLIMDGEIIGGPNSKTKNGRLVVSVPHDLYVEYKKNPNNPEIRRKMLALLPKGCTLDDFAEYGPPTESHHDHCDHCGGHHHHQQQQKQRQPQQHPHRPLAPITPTSERRPEQQVMGMYNCPDCHQQHPILPAGQMDEHFFDDTDIDMPNEPQQRPRVVTRQVTQMIITEPTIDESNPSVVQRRTITRTLVVMSRSRDNAPINDLNMPQMIEPNYGDENEEDFLLQQAMARSMLEGAGVTDDIRDSFIKQQTEELIQRTEKINQRMLDAAIAHSLLTSELERKQMEQTGNLTPITTPNSEPINTKTPSSLPSLSPPPTTTIGPYSPPSTNINTSSPTNTYSPSPNASLSAPPNTPSSPMNTSIVPPTNTSPSPPPPPPTTTTNSSLPAVVNSPPSIATDSTTDSSPPVVVNSTPPIATNSTPSSPMTADLSSPTLTHSDPPQSPTVEELRQRRLQNSGNRHRSIISSQSNFDD